MKLGKFVLLVIVVNCALFGAFTYSASKSGLTALNNLHRKKVQGLKYYHRNVDGSQLFVLMSNILVIQKLEIILNVIGMPVHERRNLFRQNVRNDFE